MPSSAMQQRLKDVKPDKFVPINNSGGKREGDTYSVFHPDPKNGNIGTIAIAMHEVFGVFIGVRVQGESDQDGVKGNIMNFDNWTNLPPAKARALAYALIQRAAEYEGREDGPA